MSAVFDSSRGAQQSAHDFLSGGGELGARMRAFDWAGTSLGPQDYWPRSLKTAVRIMLTSRQPIWIGWGKDLIYFYNDPYKSIIGGKHPWALGRPTKQVWREIWNDIGPMLETAMGGDSGTYVEEQLLIMERSGYPEETYYTFSYSPIPDDDGSSGGIICANTDDTRRVIGERQLALLREVAAASSEARTLEQACERTMRALTTNTRDLPFAILYLTEGGGERVSLVGASNITSEHATVQSIKSHRSLKWPIADVLRKREPLLISDLAASFGSELPSGAWDRAPRQAALIPVPSRGDTGRSGVLVVGLNPFRLFDDDYRRFLNLLAGEIAAGIANAQAYEEERRRAEALAEIDRAKTAFFSNVSHEFRTPLSLMLGPIEDALNDSSSPLAAAHRDRLEAAHRNSLRLLRLVNSLLDFSRIEAGRARAKFQPTDLSAFTAELASNFESATERAGLKLAIRCQPLPEAVFVDREMWEKIVLNLVSNAYKFTFEGEIAVDLHATADGSSVELVVRDTGTGIAKEELPHLFERFHRIEGAKGRTIEGSGIGLALVCELIKQHGGSIHVDSEVGRGSVFTVRLPRGAAHLPHDRIVAEQTPPEASARAEAYVQEALRWIPGSAQPQTLGAPAVEHLDEDMGAARGTGQRVLVADDNADMREYVCRLLGSRGYRVEAVADGEAALAAARRLKPDLILCDVMMPRLDGFGLLARLRADTDLRSLPIILLSARAGEEARVDGIDAGADDYISKPFAARELLARVRTNLQLASIRREAEEAQREQAARLEAVVSTVPTAVWFTHDPEARKIYGNGYGAELLRVPSGRNVSLSAPEDERPAYRVFRNGEEVPATALPLQRAVRGENVRDEELEIRFDDGSAITAIFQASPIVDTLGAVRGAVCGAVDITERKREQQRRDLLLNELNHRVKNTLATVQSLAMQTLRNAANLRDGHAAFEARLIALSKAHDVLVREHWEGAGLHEIIRGALAPYSVAERECRLTFAGPELRLQPKPALALSMALHELATNAIKYGALSNRSGRVEVDWRIGHDQQGEFELQWVEIGGPPVLPPRKHGFGSRLIQQGLSQDLAGTAELRFLSDGVVCVIRAALDEIRAGMDADNQSA